MKCPNCGAEYAEKVAFCTNCGTKMPDPAEQPIPTVAPVTEESKKNALDELMDKLTPVAEKIKDFFSVKKNIMIVAIALVALIAVIIIISAISSANTGYITYDDFYSTSANDDNELVLLHNGKVIDTSYEYNGTVSSAQSQDGSVYVFRTGEGVLAYVKGGKITEIEEEGVRDFKLASGGKAVAYTTEEGFYLYTIGGKSEEIEDDEFPIGSFCISPNGKSVLYNVMEDNEGTIELTTYYYDGKDSTKVASDATPVGVSDGGKYIYYVNTNDEGENNVYSYNLKKSEKTKLESYNSIYFNSDLSQAMIVNAEGKTYISEKGKDAEKASSKALHLLYGDKSRSVNSIYPVDSFYGKLFEGDSNVYLLDKNSDKTEKVLSNISGLIIDDSYETLFYTDDGELYVTKVSYGEKAEDKAKMLADDVVDFEVTSNGKTVYYISDEEVFAKNASGSGEAKRVSSDDVSSSLVIDDNDNLYFICDDELHAVKGKKTSVCVLEDYTSRSLRGGYLYAFDEDSAYFINGTKTEKLFDFSDLLFSY